MPQQEVNCPHYRYEMMVLSKICLYLYRYAVLSKKVRAVSVRFMRFFRITTCKQHFDLIAKL